MITIAYRLETILKIDKGVRSLLWKGGHPRIAYPTLCCNAYNGGIALPDIAAYYRAAHLIVVNDWQFAPQDHPTYRLERTGF